MRQQGESAQHLPNILEVTPVEFIRPVLIYIYNHYGVPRLGSSKNLLANARDTGDLGSVPGLGRSPGEGNGNPLPYSFLGNSTDRGAWWARVNGVAKSQTRLSTHTGTISLGFLGDSVVKNPPAKQETWV